MSYYGFRDSKSEYLDFEAEYTREASSNFLNTTGITAEAWRQVVLKMRKEAHDMWTAAGGERQPFNFK